MSNEFNLFGLEEDVVDTKYTTKVGVPQYLPKNSKPSLYELYSDVKYKQLIRNISVANITDEEKEFLKLAATRHIVFTYSKIADYYAHASKEMQELMEQSALVIIDFNDAIANGYVKLSKNIKDIMEKTGTAVSENNHNQYAKKQGE